MTNKKQQPVTTLRDGACKATIWANQSEKGVFHTVSLARTFRGADEQLQDTNSFSGIELLRIARLAEKAYDAVATLKSDHADEFDVAMPS
jgi:hypothetical protein